MKKFTKKCKRALVVALTIALVGNSIDLSMLNVHAENESGIEVDGGVVSGGDMSTGESASAMAGDAGAGADVNALNGDSVSDSEAGSVSDSDF